MESAKEKPIFVLCGTPVVLKKGAAYTKEAIRININKKISN
jgi:GTP:adenosylcobinamide-phosphate guanylyltransferase